MGHRIGATREYGWGGASGRYNGVYLEEVALFQQGLALPGDRFPFAAVPRKSY